MHEWRSYSVIFHLLYSKYSSFVTCVILSAHFSVPPCGAEHLLPEVCVVDASWTLPGASPPCLFCQRGRRSHEGNLRLHGWPVSTSNFLPIFSTFGKTLFQQRNWISFWPRVQMIPIIVSHLIEGHLIYVNRRSVFLYRPIKHIFVVKC